MAQPIKEMKCENCGYEGSMILATKTSHGNFYKCPKCDAGTSDS